MTEIDMLVCPHCHKFIQFKTNSEEAIFDICKTTRTEFNMMDNGK